MSERPRPLAGPIRAWLELDLDTEPVRGTLTPAGGSANRFVGCLGLTAAIEGLRKADAGRAAATDSTPKEAPVLDARPASRRTRRRPRVRKEKP